MRSGFSICIMDGAGFSRQPSAISRQVNLEFAEKWFT
jgi:hypothetical protein